MATAVPPWLNKSDYSWQTTASTLIAFQCIPGLVLLYGGLVKKKWAINSALIVILAFAEVVLCWVMFGYSLAFGEELIPFWGKPFPVLGHKTLLKQAMIPATLHHYHNGTVETETTAPFFPLATMVWYQCMFATTAVISVGGSVLGRIDIRAWMTFVPMWVTFSYTVGAFSLWGGGFLYHWGVIDYAGGYVIHLSSGIAGLTTAYWVGPRIKADRETFQPNNILMMLAGAGLVWIGWSGYTGGSPYSANIDSSIAVLNTNICAATSLLAWTFLNLIYAKHICVTGSVQGLMAGLVCITPGAGLVEGWAAIIMGICSGGMSWYMIMIAQKNWWILQQIDDTLGSFHANAIIGYLGGILTGLFAEPSLCSLYLPVTNSNGAFYGGMGGIQLLKQIVGGAFIIAWNIVITSAICLMIRYLMPLRMPDNMLLVGDKVVHQEEAYPLIEGGDSPTRQEPLSLTEKRGQTDGQGEASLTEDEEKGQH